MQYFLNDGVYPDDPCQDVIHCIPSPYAHDLLEGLTELRIEDSVDDRIHEAIDVAEPCGEDESGHARTAVLIEFSAHRLHDVTGEER